MKTKVREKNRERQKEKGGRKEKERKRLISIVFPKLKCFWLVSYLFVVRSSPLKL